MIDVGDDREIADPFHGVRRARRTRAAADYSLRPSASCRRSVRSSRSYRGRRRTSKGLPETRRKTIPGARARTSLCAHGLGKPLRCAPAHRGAPSRARSTTKTRRQRSGGAECVGGGRRWRRRDAMGVRRGRVRTGMCALEPQGWRLGVPRRTPIAARRRRRRALTAGHASPRVDVNAARDGGTNGVRGRRGGASTRSASSGYDGELDVAVAEHRDPQTVAALESHAAVDVDKLDRGAAAYDRLELRREILAEVAPGTAIENECAHRRSDAAAFGPACRARPASATPARRAPRSRHPQPRRLRRRDRSRARRARRAHHREAP